MPAAAAVSAAALAGLTVAAVGAATGWAELAEVVGTTAAVLAAAVLIGLAVASVAMARGTSTTRGPSFGKPRPRETAEDEAKGFSGVRGGGGHTKPRALRAERGGRN